MMQAEEVREDILKQRHSLKVCISFIRNLNLFQVLLLT